MFDILFRGESLTVEIDTYTDGRPALQAYDTDGFPYSRLTANLPQYGLAADEVAVKSRKWLMALLAAGVVADTGVTLPMVTGRRMCAVCWRDVTSSSGVGRGGDTRTASLFF